jgi:hypothetical protein
MTSQQKRWLADKLGDLANLVTAALLFGQFTTDSFRPMPAGVAVVMFSLAFFVGNHLLKG